MRRIVIAIITVAVLMLAGCKTEPCISPSPSILGSVICIPTKEMASCPLGRAGDYLAEDEYGDFRLVHPDDIHTEDGKQFVAKEKTAIELLRESGNAPEPVKKGTVGWACKYQLAEQDENMKSECGLIKAVQELQLCWYSKRQEDRDRYCGGAK